MKPLHTLFAAAALAASTLAQTPSATRTVAGDFNDGFDPDVLVLRGADVEFHYGPRDFPFRYDLGIAAHDIALAKGHGPGGLDSIAWVGPAGLSRSHYTPQTPGQLFAHSTLSSTGGWMGAERVLVARDSSVFVGLASGGTTVLVYDEATTTTTSFSLPAQALDMVLMDYNGDGVDDIFVACTSGVHISSRDGTSLRDIFVPLDEAYVARISQSDIAHDRAVMAITIQGATSQTLQAIDIGGVDAPSPLAPYSAHSVVSGDLDQDGRDDLVVMHRTPLSSGLPTPLRFYNTAGASPSFSLTNSAHWELPSGATPTSSQEAWPVLEDFMRDGDLDVAVFLEDTQDLAIGANPHVDHTDHDLAFGRLYGKQCTTNDNIRYLNTVHLLPTTQLAGATSLVSEHWNVSIDANGTDVLMSPSGAVHTQSHTIPVGGLNSMEFTHGVGTLGAGGVRFIRFYLGIVDANDDIIAAGPTTTLVCTFIESLAIPMTAVGSGGQGMFVYEYDECGNHPSGGPGGSSTDGGSSNPPRPPSGGTGASGQTGSSGGPDDPPVTGGD